MKPKRRINPSPGSRSALNNIIDEVNAIVDGYGGARIECGPISSDYVPFAELFEEAA